MEDVEQGVCLGDEFRDTFESTTLLEPRKIHPTRVSQFLIGCDVEGHAKKCAERHCEFAKQNDVNTGNIVVGH